VALVPARAGPSELPAHQPAEHRHRRIGQAEAELDQLGRHRGAAATGVQVGGEMGRGGLAFAHQLAPAVGVDALAVPGIGGGAADDVQPL
jgi:hypothetical protein